MISLGIIPDGHLSDLSLKTTSDGCSSNPPANTSLFFAATFNEVVSCYNVIHRFSVR